MARMTNAVTQVPSDAQRPVSTPADVTRRLLNSAIEVFAERGYESATVAGIARRSGLTTGAIYARWLTKREMFVAVVEHISAQRMEHLTANGASDPATAGRHLAIAAGLMPSGPDESHNLWIEASVAAARDPELRAIMGDLLEGEADALADIAAEAKSAGVLDPALSTDALVLFSQAVGLGFQLLRRVQDGQGKLPSEAELDALSSRLSSAFAPTSPS